ncbi:MAG: ABC transporter permease [Rhodobacteraceae bacterium]|nr:ABC transporter permease [Paracoccaceae bacterium]
MLRLEQRQQSSKTMLYLTPVLAVVSTMVVGGALFLAMGINPFDAIYLLFIDPFIDSYNLSQLFVKASPLILIAMGLSIGFKAGVWNIGAEGQFVIGALSGGAVGLALWGSTGWWILPLMAVAAAIGGALWALIPAVLKIRFNANEILVSLMLVYVAENLLAQMVQGVLRNPEGMGFPESRNLARNDPTSLPDFFDPLGIDAGGVVMLLLLAGAFFLLQKHALGFQIKLTGESPRAARFAGVKPGIIIAVTLGISGAAAGLAGLFELTGAAGKLTIDFPVGYGFTAIIVAFLGRLNPIGILLAGVVLAGTYIGGENAQFLLKLPAAAVTVFQGMMLFFLLGFEILINYRVIRVRRAA